MTPPHPSILGQIRLILLAGLLATGWVEGQDSAAEGQGVTLEDRGKTVVLDNGIVRCEVDKGDGNLLSVTYHHASILASPGYFDWVSDGNHHLRGTYQLCVDPASNQGGMAELSISQKYDGTGFPMDVEFHYVMRRGDGGFYNFAVFTHPASYPAAEIGQSRWVLNVNDKVFDYINVDDQRRQFMPPPDTPVKILGPKESMMFTDGPFKGQITDKYLWYAEMGGDHFVHGWSGSVSNLGCWIVNGSNEDRNGGPTKQHNEAQWGRLLFKILTCGHYGSAPVTVPAGESWQKIYGPWMLYLNAGTDTNALWEDAKKKAQTERAAWPYAWMNHPAYPLAANRGSVKGQFKITDPQYPGISVSQVWVGLADPYPDWQQQSNGYQYWVHADANGHFVIPNIRPGSYTLYAFADGEMGEFRHDGVTVTKGQTLDLGAQDWTPVRYGQQLWQIGVPDRTAKEFRHGDDYHHWNLMQDYTQEFPNNVNFVVGKSHERTDWDFAQACVQKNGAWVGTVWKILFDIPDSAPRTGTGTLRIALAAAHNAVLNIGLNGQPIGRMRVNTDNAIIREGIHGQYSEWDFIFDASSLKSTGNTIAFDLTATPNPNPAKGVMYDCIRLELDNTRPYDKLKAPPKPEVSQANKDEGE